MPRDFGCNKFFKKQGGIDANDIVTSCGIFATKKAMFRNIK